jgi:hypothetical protein
MLEKSKKFIIVQKKKEAKFLKKRISSNKVFVAMQFNQFC